MISEKCKPKSKSITYVVQGLLVGGEKCKSRPITYVVQGPLVRGKIRGDMKVDLASRDGDALT